jgi:hypothetical protein
MVFSKSMTMIGVRTPGIKTRGEASDLGCLWCASEQALELTNRCPRSSTTTYERMTEQDISWDVRGTCLNGLGEILN